MLNDGSGFKKVYLATGFTDLRRVLQRILFDAIICRIQKIKTSHF